MMSDRGQRQSLPASAQALCGVRDVARFLTRRLVERKPAVLLRYGDTSGRILAQAAAGKVDAYTRHFLGSAVSPGQLVWFAQQLEQSLSVADVVGLRSDLLGPMLPDDVLTGPAADILPRLAALYPLRSINRISNKPEVARRLAQTRKAMEGMALPVQALLTDAWIHVGLLEAGFFSAIFRHAPAFAVCTSLKSRGVLQQMAKAQPDRFRFYECPCYPWEEKELGGNHAFLWDRWQMLGSGLKPAYPGEPLLISAGIWTKVIGPQWARRGGIAIDMGSAIDYLALDPSRPAVLATRYGDADKVPPELSLEWQLSRVETLDDFLAV